MRFPQHSRPKRRADRTGPTRIAVPADILPRRKIFCSQAESIPFGAILPPCPRSGSTRGRTAAADSKRHHTQRISCKTASRDGKNNHGSPRPARRATSLTRYGSRRCHGGRRRCMGRKSWLAIPERVSPPDSGAAARGSTTCDPQLAPHTNACGDYSPICTSSFSAAERPREISWSARETVTMSASGWWVSTRPAMPSEMPALDR